MNRYRRIVALLAAVFLSTGMVLIAPGVAEAQPALPSQLRMAHFSPDTPPMDVYVTGFDGQQRRVLDGLSYTQVSQYLNLNPGFYTFAMRPAGADESSPPVVSDSAELTASDAYTFAALGRSERLRTELYEDELNPPATGNASVRLVHASSKAQTVSVQAAGGPVLADTLGFAQVSDYAVVPGQSWTLSITPTDGNSAATSAAVDLAAGQVVTLVLVDDPVTQGLKVVSVLDATGMDLVASGGAATPTPVGGIETGAGGTAATYTEGTGSLVPVVVVLAIALIGFAAAVTVMVPGPARRRLRAERVR